MRDNSRPHLIGLALVLGLLLSACKPLVPATTPPQLEWTAGPPVVITDRVYETVEFTVEYPSGWRVVTGEAHLPPTATFVAPDDVSTITLVMGDLLGDDYGEEGMMTIMEGVTLKSGKTMTAMGKAPAESWEAFLPVFEAVVDSLR